MSDLLADLESLGEEARAALGRAADRALLQAWYAEFLSRKGRLPQPMRGLGQLPGEKRAEAGRAVNELKSALEEGFAARQAEVEARELEAALEAERVDVTLPGRPADLGRIHPSTHILREIYRILGGMGF